MVSLLFSLTLVFGASAQSNVSTAVASNRFEKYVQAYEAADRTNPPPQSAILLLGDSQFFRGKTVAEDLPDYTTVNRGIDSFQTMRAICRGCSSCVRCSANPIEKQSR